MGPALTIESEPPCLESMPVDRLRGRQLKRSDLPTIELESPGALRLRSVLVKTPALESVLLR